MKNRIFAAALVGIIVAAIFGADSASASTEKWRTIGQTWNGLGIQANQYTSTNFAGHAGMAAQRWTKKIRVYSNATHRFVKMTCKGGTSSYKPRTCRGGNHAAIRLVS